MKNFNFQFSIFKLRSRNQRGYTLVEVLIYSLILAVFLLLTSQLFISVKNINAYSIALVGLQSNLRQIESDLFQTVKKASNVVTPQPGNSATTLSLNNGAIVYQLSGGVLQKTQSGQTWPLTTDEVTVSQLSFENSVEATQTATITVIMKVESNYLLETGNKLLENFKTTVSLR